MDSQTLSLISAIITTPVIMRLAEGWLTSRKDTRLDSASRLDKLEKAVADERERNEAINKKLFDVAVAYEGLKVRFELLQDELRKCKDRENGKVPH